MKLLLRRCFGKIYILEKPINVNVDMEANEDNLGTKKRINTECIKLILFSTLMTDSHISYSWYLKTILFANGPLKTQDSQVFSFIFLLTFLITSQIFYTRKQILILRLVWKKMWNFEIKWKIEIIVKKMFWEDGYPVRVIRMWRERQRG